MCWNKDISLNTFLFSIFVLLLVMYNNAFTKYKIPELNHFWVYMFFISFITMQLIEYFIWVNIHNSYYNSFFSIMAFILLLFQPIISIMILNDTNLKKWIIIMYVIYASTYSIYMFSTTRMYSSVSKMGHLKWPFLTQKEPIFLIAWLFFFLFSFFYNKTYFGFIFGITTYLIILYNYYRDQSVGSMWCWVVNSIMIYYAVYLLIYLPFQEKNKLCH